VRALIIGCAGQDGRYLADYLSNKGYWVGGVDRTEPHSDQQLAKYWQCDLRDSSSLKSPIEESCPDELYYLAAMNFSSADENVHSAVLADLFTVNTTGAAVCLSTIAAHLSRCRFFYAGSCHVFGQPAVSPQSENTPHNPTTPYGISKSAGLRLCKYFREFRGVFAVGGILFNHESPLRRPPFVTAQLARAAALAASGTGEAVILRDPEAIVDWGAARDFVEGMWLALNHHEPDDYVIATGVPRTVREFATAAFDHVGTRAEDWITLTSLEPSTQMRPVPYIGDSSYLRRATGWVPRTTFEQLVHEMVDAYKSGQPT
jgi:GDPmannose 4,6-dehydratase